MEHVAHLTAVSTWCRGMRQIGAIRSGQLLAFRSPTAHLLQTGVQQLILNVMYLGPHMILQDYMPLYDQLFTRQ